MDNERRLYWLTIKTPWDTIAEAAIVSATDADEARRYAAGNSDNDAWLDSDAHDVTRAGVVHRWKV